MSNYHKLQAVLKEIFEMDKADLDFGIYRIMNQKRDQVMDFIDNRLPKEIKSILSQTQSKDGIGLQAELEQMGKSLDAAGVVREMAPKYVSLKNKLANSIDINALEQEVFSHLASFFKRYYKEGDFISMRRYKKDVYAIPYEGEEVKLHWANHDQYYIKTSEHLKNYAFKLGDGKKVIFQLKEASTEQNNNKTQGDAERRFAIFEELPVEIIDDELHINFTYEPHQKTVKQTDLETKAIEVIRSSVVSLNAVEDFAGIFDNAPTEKNKNRTLLEKHLNDFISRNTFDYFIHKDLGVFLSRELDFYIKNEVLFIDDINTEERAYFTAQLSKIKALKTVASKIIDFLAQIEDFQKKLWLKKKFVISTNYCITLDRIPEGYYPEILANQAQLNEWKALFACEITTNNGKVIINGEDIINNSPLTINNYLVLDTKHFSEDFKDKLLAEFDNLDEETDGILINSENFQALNVMQEKYQEKINTIYIDPPYNTKASEIAYKNSFKHSSWMSLIESRILMSKNILDGKGVICTTIDDYEFIPLWNILENTYSKENHLGNISIRINPKGRIVTNAISTTHEYAIFFGKSENSKINKFPVKPEDKSHNYIQDKDGSWYVAVNLRKQGVDSEGERNGELLPRHYPIYFEPSTNEISISKVLSEKILPIDGNGEKRIWRRGFEVIEEMVRNEEIWVKNTNNGFQVYFKFRGGLDGETPKSLWVDSKYSASEYGTKILDNILGKREVFSYPKSPFATKDCIYISSDKESCILDFFAGSGTTGHATIKLNREDGGKRKYILVEMGTYFNTVTKPRIQKVIYSDNWKNGKPQDKAGISQLFKYQVLESYEDALNNLKIRNSNQDALLQFGEHAQEEYLLHYMLDVETRDHLFDLEIFRNPFNYQLKVTENNELVPTKVDLVETFNYLIGMYVARMQRVKDIKLVEGKTRAGEKTLIIWRNLDTTSQEEVARVFRKLYDGIRSAEFDQIYINGDHHFENIRTGEDTFKVKLIEETFFKQMFNISEL